MVETYVSYLRKKLERHGPPLIHTIRLVGYTLRESGGPVGVAPAPAAPRRRRGGADGARHRGRRHLPGTALVPLQPDRPVTRAVAHAHRRSPSAAPRGRTPAAGRSRRRALPQRPGWPTPGPGRRTRPRRRPATTTTSEPPSLRRLRRPHHRPAARAAARHLRRGPELVERSVLCRSTPAEFGSTATTDAPTLPTHITGLRVELRRTSANRPRTSPRVADATTGSTGSGRRSSAEGPYTGGQLLVGVPLGSTVSTLDRLVGSRARRDRRRPRGGLADGLVAGAGRASVPCAPSRARPTPSPGASSPSGSPARRRAPRWDVWPGPSTPCWGASRGRSPNATPRSRSSGRRKAGCGNSSPMPRTSCAPRSPRSPPTPSSSNRARRRAPTTSSA